MSRHQFKTKITHNPREAQRWRCTGCGVKRRRVVPAPASFEHFGKMRAFDMFQQPGSVLWTNRAGACTRLRTHLRGMR